MALEESTENAVNMCAYGRLANPVERVFWAVFRKPTGRYESFANHDFPCLNETLDANFCVTPARGFQSAISERPFQNEIAHYRSLASLRTTSLGSKANLQEDPWISS